MKYKMVLFDIDGVFLSEERCFDVSALTVWDLLSNPKLLGYSKPSLPIDPNEATLQNIRQDVYQEDKVLRYLKDRGVNSNWDMAYLVVIPQILDLLEHLAVHDEKWVHYFLQGPMDREALQKLGEICHQYQLEWSPNFAHFFAFYQENGEERRNRQELLEYSRQWIRDKWGIEIPSVARSSQLWKLGQALYQEWYLGEKLYWETEKNEPLDMGKKGYLTEEIPLADPKEYRELFASLHHAGTIVGFGTGRSKVEALIPLQEMGLLEKIDPERVITATDVMLAEEKYPELAPLGKPEPYTYLKGYDGGNSTLETILAQELPLPLRQEVLIVGDSVADLLAARKMGCAFAATLTGLNGLADRKLFEELEADYIIENVTDLRREVLLID